MPWETVGLGVWETHVHIQIPHHATRACHRISSGLKFLVHNGDVKTTSQVAVTIK